MNLLNWAQDQTSRDLPLFFFLVLLLLMYVLIYIYNSNIFISCLGSHAGYETHLPTNGRIATPACFVNPTSPLCSENVVMQKWKEINAHLICEAINWSYSVATMGTEEAHVWVCHHSHQAVKHASASTAMHACWYIITILEDERTKIFQSILKVFTYLAPRSMKPHGIKLFLVLSLVVTVILEMELFFCRLLLQHCLHSTW
jgi:hypothetical protein